MSVILKLKPGPSARQFQDIKNIDILNNDTSEVDSPAKPNDPI